MTISPRRDFARDQRLCEAATQGPWTVRSSYYGVMRFDIRSSMFDIRLRNEANARFIAEAREGWPAALDEIDRLRRALRWIAEYQRDIYESPLHAYDNCKVIAREALQNDPQEVGA